MGFNKPGVVPPAPAALDIPRTSLAELPADCLLSILTQLNPDEQSDLQTVAQAAQTCRAFRDVVTDEFFWMIMSRKLWEAPSPEQFNGSYLALFRARHESQANWLNRRFVMTTFRNSNGAKFSCLSFHNGLALTVCCAPRRLCHWFLLLQGSEDRAVRVFDVQAERCLYELPGAGDMIGFVAGTGLVGRDSNALTVGAASADGHVRIWRNLPIGDAAAGALPAPTPVDIAGLPGDRAVARE